MSMLISLPAQSRSDGEPLVHALCGRDFIDAMFTDEPEEPKSGCALHRSTLQVKRMTDLLGAASTVFVEAIESGC